MKLHYFPDTDTLSIKLKDAPSTETEEITHDVVVDFDASGNVISIDIDLACRRWQVAGNTLGI